MPTNFIESFSRQNPSGFFSGGENSKFSNMSLGTVPQKLLNLVPGASEAYSALTTKAQVYAEVIPALAYDIEAFPDPAELTADLEMADASKFINEIDVNTVDTIVASITESVIYAHEQENEIQQQVAMTLTDQKGQVFEMIVNKDQELHDGVTSVITTTVNPQDKSDCLIFIENGKYKLNTLIKSKGFWRPNQQYTSPQDISSCLLSIFDWLDLESQSDTLLGQVLDLCNFYNLQISDTIEENVQAIATYYDIEYVDILSTLQAVDYELYTEKGDDPFGSFQFLADLLSDLMLSDTINNILLTALDLIRTATFTIAAFTAQFTELIVSGAVCVKRIIQGICAAFTSGGLLGVARYVLNVIKGTEDLYYDEDEGVLKFSDNNTLVPTEYISGMICKIVGAIASVVGVIASMFSAGIGLAITAAGSLLVKVGESIKYDYDQGTRALLNYPDNTGIDSMIMPYFPHGFFQGVYDRSSLSRQLYNLLEQEPGAYALKVPGGLVLFGPDNDPSKFRMEFHPALCKYDSSHISNIRFVYRRTRPVLEQYPYFGLDVSHMKNKISRKNVLDAWATAQPLDVKVDSEGYVTQSVDDYRLRLAIMRSISIYLLWNFVCQGQDFDCSDIKDDSIDVFALFFQSLTSLNSYSGFFDNDYSDYVEVDEANLHKDINIFSYFALSDEALIDIANANYDFDCGVDNEVANNQFLKFVALTTAVLPQWTQLPDLCDESTDGMYLSINMIYHSKTGAQPPASRLKSAALGLSYPIKIFPGNFTLSICESLPSNFQWALRTPKYNRNTFIFWLALVGIAAVAVTVTSVVASVAMKIKIARKQAQNAAQVEHDWTSFVNHPTDLSYYNTYKKSVRKNNMFASITGGTKYSKLSYWQSPESASGSPGTSGIITQIFKQDPVDFAASENTVLISETSNTSTDQNDLIYQSITGHNI